MAGTIRTVFTFAAALVAGATVALEARAQTQAEPVGNPDCWALEARLASLGSGREKILETLAKLDNDLATANRFLRKQIRRADQQGCRPKQETGFFLFKPKPKKPPRRCNKILRKIKAADQARERLEGERARLQHRMQGGGSRERDRIIDALARHGCGQQYEQARRKPKRRSLFSSLFGDDPSADYGNSSVRYERQFNNSLGVSTYRTICVRQCDGYFYPISFATVPSRFQYDSNICQNTCGGDTELYIYRNPGGDLESAVNLAGTSYSELPNAFRYRSELVNECSCSERPVTLPGPNRELLHDKMDRPKKTAESTAGDAPDSDQQPPAEAAPQESDAGQTTTQAANQG